MITADKKRQRLALQVDCVRAFGSLSYMRQEDVAAVWPTSRAEGAYRVPGAKAGALSNLPVAGAHDLGPAQDLRRGLIHAGVLQTGTMRMGAQYRYL